MRLYRFLLWLYPRQFRREYADDMVAMLMEQVRAERTLRVVGRTALDLILTIPIRHMEVLMPTSSATPLIITLVTVAAALVVFGGAVGLTGALSLIAVAGLVWHRHRPVVARSDTRWWKLLFGGLLLLGTWSVVTISTGELPNGGWYVAMATLFIALALIGAGVVLGVATRVRAASSFE